MPETLRWCFNPANNGCDIKRGKIRLWRSTTPLFLLRLVHNKKELGVGGDVQCRYWNLTDPFHIQCEWRASPAKGYMLVHSWLCQINYHASLMCVGPLGTQRNIPETAPLPSSWTLAMEGSRPSHPAISLVPASGELTNSLSLPRTTDFSMVPCEIWGQLSSSLTLASSWSPFSLPSRLISLDNMSRSEESYRHWKSVSWGPLAFLGHRWHHKILRALRDTVEFPEKGLTMSSGMGLYLLATISPWTDWVQAEVCFPRVCLVTPQRKPFSISSFQNQKFLSLCFIKIFSRLPPPMGS